MVRIRFILERLLPGELDSHLTISLGNSMIFDFMAMQGVMLKYLPTLNQRGINLANHLDAEHQ